MHAQVRQLDVSCLQCIALPMSLMSSPGPAEGQYADTDPTHQYIPVMLLLDLTQALWCAGRTEVSCTTKACCTLLGGVALELH